MGRRLQPVARLPTPAQTASEGRPTPGQGSRPRQRLGPHPTTTGRRERLCRLARPPDPGPIAAPASATVPWTYRRACRFRQPIAAPSTSSNATTGAFGAPGREWPSRVPPPGNRTPRSQRLPARRPPQQTGRVLRDSLPHEEQWRRLRPSFSTTSIGQRSRAPLVGLGGWRRPSRHPDRPA